ncbi:DUF1304 domain-containing protein [Ligilactobacillus faecis]|uniref:DUF1304 domain-containing protein n=1 Tax=Ligilactobacillus faecis TaxID=762833 RepID=A0ABV4DRW1_9LACO
MSLFSTILLFVVALEALYIMGLEMFASNEKLHEIFGLRKEYLEMPEARVAMANQGLYNGFIGAGLLLSRFVLPSNAQYGASLMFICFVVVAAIYGWLSAKNPKILLAQGSPALLALLALLILH